MISKLSYVSNTSTFLVIYAVSTLCYFDYSDCWLSECFDGEGDRCLEAVGDLFSGDRRCLDEVFDDY